MTELQLFSWGANSHGQLGLGYESEMCTTPVKVPSDTPIKLNKIEMMRGGGGHLLILDKNGKLNACGWNNKGQLGLDTTEDAYSITRLPEIGTRIVDIACGWDSSAAIDEHGRLYVWGSNAFDQLGYSARRTTSKFQLPKILNLPCTEKAVQVSFGLRFMSILCENGTVYIVGRWKFRDHFETITYNETNFYRLKDASRISSLSSGSNHIVCANDSKSVIGFGDNKFNQCNLQTIENERIKCIRSGWSHNGILTDSGNVYLWGRNSYGELANTRTEKSDSLMKLSGIEDKIREFHLGSEHGMSVTEEGLVHTWGWNEHGNCGNGNETNVFAPYCVPLPGRSLMCTTGAGFCLALVEC